MEKVFFVAIYLRCIYNILLY